MMVELRPMPDGSFDEMVAKGALFVAEMMDDRTLFISLSDGRPDGKLWHLWVSARGKLTVTPMEDP